MSFLFNLNKKNHGHGSVDDADAAEVSKAQLDEAQSCWASHDARRDPGVEMGWTFPPLIFFLNRDRDLRLRLHQAMRGATLRGREQADEAEPCLF